VRPVVDIRKLGFSWTAGICSMQKMTARIMAAGWVKFEQAFLVIFNSVGLKIILNKINTSNRHLGILVG
jgi:hypothetical protein